MLRGAVEKRGAPSKSAGRRRKAQDAVEKRGAPSKSAGRRRKAQDAVEKRWKERGHDGMQKSDAGGSGPGSRNL